MIKRFETKLLEEAFEFIEKQNLKTRKKIFQNIRRAEQQSDPKFFKKLTNDIWEFRTLYSGNKKFLETDYPRLSHRGMI
tara:strand:- start:242 stop:478 length:237 start_codon:yes stop_codon:yes gene_type:complete